jgi:hypothetical protein
MSLSMRQMAGTGWITTTNGTFLEMALQNIAPREGITTKYAHVRSISSMSKKMALQVFRM